MGGIGDFLFGSKPESSGSSSSSSGNYAYPTILANFGPAMGYTSAAGNMMGNLLGLNTSSPVAPTTPAPTPTTGGPTTTLPGTNTGRPTPFLDRMREKRGIEPETPAPVTVPTYTPVGTPTAGTDNQTSALDNWANSGGMKFIMDQGVKALEGSQAGKGMYDSGATGKALMKYGTGLGSTYLNQYMDNLLKHAQLGVQAGGLVGSTGAWSKSSGTQSGSGGKQGALPGIISAVAGIPGVSDIRLKTSIEYVGTNEQGIRIYEFSFVDPELPAGRHRGPMAHEVKEKLPEAFIKDFWKGYDGVDYSKIKGL